eukprot:tig00000880_g5170.t1
MFVNNYGMRPADDAESQRVKILSKVLDEYDAVKDIPPPAQVNTVTASGSAAPPGSIPLFIHPSQVMSKETANAPDRPVVAGTHAFPNAPGVALTPDTAAESNPSESAIERVLESLPRPNKAQTASALVAYTGGAPKTPGAPGGSTPNLAQALMLKTKNTIRPDWHPPWKLMRVISGHLGWVRCVTVDCSNEWFATGSADRTIKVWDLASGTLKLTLTGHISAVRGLVSSERHPYLFSVAEDKTVKCWDLECNKVIRQYHGHLSGVYSCAVHPTLDLLFTGGRDSTVRVWDIRTKAQIHCLSGHTNTVAHVMAQGVDPQVVSCSMDTTVKLWDLAAGKCMVTLTNHKKSVRGGALHPKEFTFATASADNIKKWKLPKGEFLHNLSDHKAIVNCLAVNADGVLASGADNGSMCFWDWRTGYNFQQTQTVAQPGSLDAECGIFAMAFDVTGSRLIVGEADKSIKIWREDETATPETHPIDFKPETAPKRW